MYTLGGLRAMPQVVKNGGAGAKHPASGLRRYDQMFCYQMLTIIAHCELPESAGSLLYRTLYMECHDDHPHVVAGMVTIRLELFKQMHGQLDAIVVPVGAAVLFAGPF